MSRAMSSVQAERAGRSHIAPLSLVKLTTYTDRTASIVDKVFYFADKAVEYDYGATGTDQMFLPVVVGGSNFFSGFLHIPSPDDMTAFGKSFDLVCSNGKINGFRLATLLQYHNLESARVEISQMLLSKARMDLYAISKVVDLTALAGDEHTVLFRGRVLQVAPITDSILTIQCTLDIPSLAGFWNYASDETKTDPQDIGKRLPRVYGKAKRVPCVNYVVGWVTTLVEPLDISETGAGYKISDATGFPPGSFTLRIDGEHILCTYESETTFEIVTRAYDSTDAATHEAGALCTEMLTDTWLILSDRPSDALNALYVINPINGVLTRLDPTATPWTEELARTNLVPGQTVTSVSFDSAELAALMEYLQIQVEPAAGAPAAFGLRFFADLDGIETALQEVLEWTTGESFDSGTWEVSGCTAAYDTDRIEGSNSLKLSIDVDALAGAEVIQTETLTDWNDSANCTIAIASGEGRSGGDCLVGTSDSAGICSIWFDDAGTSIDLTGGLLVFDFKLQKGANLGGQIAIRVGSSTTDAYYFRLEAVDFVEDTWYTVVLDYLRATDITNTPDPSDIQYFSIGFNNLPGPRITGYKVFIDRIKVLPDIDRVAQNNTAGGVDYTGDGDQYRLSFKRDVGELYATVAVAISDDVGSGTTKTTDFRQINYFSLWNPDSWTTLVSYGWDDTNTPVVSDINTVRLEVSLNLIGIHLQDPTFEIRVDDLAFSSDMGNVYYGTGGEVMSHPADILRHWIVEVGGENFDSVSYDALYTSLGANAEWGFDIRSLGFTWKEILQRMAYEARCNVVAVETASGREWKMLAAGSEYGFGAPSSSSQITQTHGLSDVGRNAEELASQFSFRAGFDPSLPGGGNEEGFRLSLEVNPEGSSVPILASRVQAAAHRFGYHDAGPIASRCIQDLATAQDWAGYLVQERIDNRRSVFQLEEVAWFDALPYDVGDLVRIRPGWHDYDSETQLHNFNSGGFYWNPFHATLSTETTIVYEGDGCMKVLVDNGETTIRVSTQNDVIPPTNMTHRGISFMCYIPAGDLALIDTIGIRVSSTSVGSTEYMEFQVDASTLDEGGWQRIEFPIEGHLAYADDTLIDLTAVIEVRIVMELLASDDGTTYILVDDLRMTSPPTTCRITSMAKAFESNAWTITAVEVPEVGLRNI